MFYNDFLTQDKKLTTNLIINENEYYISIEHITADSKSYAKLNFKNFLNFKGIKTFCKKICSLRTSTTSTIFYIFLFFLIFFWKSLFDKLSMSIISSKVCKEILITSQSLTDNYYYLLILCFIIIILSIFIHNKTDYELMIFFQRIFSYYKLFFHLYFFTTHILHISLFFLCSNSEETCDKIRGLIIIWILFFSTIYCGLLISVFYIICLIKNVIRKILK
jgi:hypothetical protein